MYVAPALAAKSACTLEKHSVTFVLMPSSLRRFTVFNPSE
jgi:hypothetical protein